MNLYQQVITLTAATHKVFLPVDKKKIKEFQTQLLEWFERTHPEIVNEIENEKSLSDELVKKIIDAALEYRKEVLSL